MEIMHNGKAHILTIDTKDIHAIVQAPTGVDIIMKDGSIEHVLNAKTDGTLVWMD